MNERIRQLAEQAVKSVDIVTGNELLDDELAKMYIPDCFAEKFAELIVRECIGCCEQVISDPVPNYIDTWLNGGSQCIDQIKQHFGVDGMSTEDKKTLIKELLGVKND